MGREPRGQTGVCEGRLTDPGRAGERWSPREEAGDVPAFVVNGRLGEEWAVLAWSRWSERRGVFLAAADAGEGSLSLA